MFPMDTEEKRKYEIALLTRDEQTALKAADLLSGEGAEIIVGPRPGLIKLAYKIDKEESAFFSFIDFESLPEKIASLEKALKLDKSILRFLIVTPPPAKAVAKSFGKKPTADSAPKPEAADDTVKESLSNEALEQKLEEILS